MKKSTVITLIIIAAALLAAAGWLVFREFSSPKPEPEPPKTYDAALYEAFTAAEAKGDLIAMDKAFRKNMDETGVSFFDYEYDLTHDGKIYAYPYTVTVDDEEISGSLYVVSADVDLTLLSYGESDFVAVDMRSNSDPDVKVIASYRAESEAHIKRLCELLLAHEESHPSEWERTLTSMIEEWQMHNAAYTMEYEVDRAKDVDLNNADENTDWIKEALNNSRL